MLSLPDTLARGDVVNNIGRSFGCLTGRLNTVVDSTAQLLTSDTQHLSSVSRACRSRAGSGLRGPTPTAFLSPVEQPAPAPAPSRRSEAAKVVCAPPTKRVHSLAKTSAWARSVAPFPSSPFPLSSCLLLVPVLLVLLLGIVAAASSSMVTTSPANRCIQAATRSGRARVKGANKWDKEQWASSSSKSTSKRAAGAGVATEAAEARTAARHEARLARLHTHTLYQSRHQSSTLLKLSLCCLLLLLLVSGGGVGEGEGVPPSRDDMCAATAGSASSGLKAA